MKPKPKPEPEIAEAELSEAELDELFSDTAEDPFDSLPPRLAFIFKKYGQDELKQCLFPSGVPLNLQKRLLEAGLQSDYSREVLVSAHKELLALGLTGPAKIALEVSALKVSRFDQPSAPWIRETERQQRSTKRNGFPIVSRENS
jgi:hypothetical protein